MVVLFSRRFKLICVLSIFVMAFTSCQKAEKKELNYSIKVIYWDNNSFMRDYGNVFTAKYPNISIDVVQLKDLYVNDQGGNFNEKFNKLVAEESPDLLFLNKTQYQKMASEGALLELETQFKKDNFDTKSILPSIISYLKDASENKLYGLSPKFNSFSLFYNKDLFDSVGVEYPKDGMDWEEVFQLARRFSGASVNNEHIYGFTRNNYDQDFLSFIKMIGTTKKISMLSPDGNDITMNTELWKKTFQLITDTYKTGAINNLSDTSQSISFDDFLTNNYFLAGKGAMTIGDTTLIEMMNELQSTNNKNAPVFNWDIVTAPIDHSNPENNNIIIKQIFSVNVNSKNIDPAVKLLEFINGDDIAKINSKITGDIELLSRTSYIGEKYGHSLEAFYKLPFGYQEDDGITKLSPKSQKQLNSIVETEVKSIIKGQSSVDDALKVIQEKGKSELLQVNSQ
jgi:multiple sugar transport system substrate-binding protein